MSLSVTCDQTTASLLFSRGPSLTTPAKMRTIIVTGYPDLANAISAIKSAADDYVTKPANPDELIRIVRKHLQKQRDETEYSQTKVAGYIETRLKELELIG